MARYLFTLRVQKVLELARQEAIRFRHEGIEPEHVALALIREREGVATAVLHNLGVNVDQLSERLEAVLADCASLTSGSSTLWFSASTEEVFDLAEADARSRNHTYVGTEHILLGICAQRSSVAAQVLANFGVHESIASEVTGRLLGSPAKRT